MKSLYFLLAFEWPFLIIALALSSWGLSFIIDQRDYKPGTLYPQYGNQIITYTATWLSTTTADSTTEVVPKTTYTVTRTLSPNEYGTAYYSSIYSSIGSIPPFQQVTKRSAMPTQAPPKNVRNKDEEITGIEKRAYWADHSGFSSNVYGSLQGDSASFVRAMVIPFSLLVASLAIRVLLTPIYLAHFHFGSMTEKKQQSWNIALVSITIPSVVVLLGSAISSFSLYCDYYDDTITQSIGLIVTIVFVGLACIFSVLSSISMCIQLHKSKKKLHRQNFEEQEKRELDDNASQASSA